MSGSAAGAKRQTSRVDDEAKGLGVKDLIDAIIIANGKAKVKRWAEDSSRGEITFSLPGGESVTYTAKEFADHINEGVRKGFWTVRKHAGELDFILTDKGREFFSNYSERRVQALSHCGGRNEIDGGIVYIDDSSWEEMVLGAAASGGVFEIAAAIVAVISSASLVPVVFAAAGAIAAIGALGLQQINEGCGVKINTHTNSVSAQHCDC